MTSLTTESATMPPPTPTRRPGWFNGRLYAWDVYYGITAAGSTFRQEILGGLTTLVSMVYIVPLNSLILGYAPVEGYVPALTAIATLTAFAAALTTLAMGVLGKVPIALAAGLGINGVVAFQIAPVIGYRGAMAVVMIEGLLTFFLVVTGIRKKLFEAIPVVLKHAIAAGIGAFLVLIGFIDANVIKGNAGVPPLILQDLLTIPIAVFVVTLLVGFILQVLRKKWAYIGAITIGTVLAFILQGLYAPGGWALNSPDFVDKDLLAGPDWSIFAQFSLSGFGDLWVAGPIVVFYIASLVVADLFDTAGTIVAVGEEAKYLDKEGNPPRLGWILGIDSLAAFVGGLFHVSSNTSYIESATGASAGARTGFASVVTAIGFGVVVLFSPLAQLVPSEAAAPILVLVGAQMVWGLIKYVGNSVVQTTLTAVNVVESETRLALENGGEIVLDASDVDVDSESTATVAVGETGASQLTLSALFDKIRQVIRVAAEAYWEGAFLYSFPVVATVLLMPSAFGIAAGIGAGFIFFTIGTVVLRLSRKYRVSVEKVKGWMWTMAILFVFFFALPLIRSWLGL